MFWALILLVLGNMVFFALHLKEDDSLTGSFLPPLSKKEEAEQFARLARGDKKAREALILHNLRLVAHVCKKYRQDEKIEVDDLVSIGTVGLIKAVDSYSSDHKTAFSTYAARCVENEILMQYRKLKKYEGTVLLSDHPGSDEDSGMTFLDIAGEDEDIQTFAELKQDALQLRNAINTCLDARERMIVKLRYGLQGEKMHTQNEVAAVLRISRSYVSRIEKKALQKLRQVLEE